MKEVKPDIIILSNCCPECSSRMYASWNMPVGDNPPAPVWSVECDNVQCDYVYSIQFKNLENLVRVFEAED